MKVCRRRMVIGGHRVWVASLPYTLTSDAGHLMAGANRSPRVIWDTEDGRFFSALRTVESTFQMSPSSTAAAVMRALQGSRCRAITNWRNHDRIHPPPAPAGMARSATGMGMSSRITCLLVRSDKALDMAIVDFPKRSRSFDRFEDGYNTAIDDMEEARDGRA